MSKKFALFSILVLFAFIYWCDSKENNVVNQCYEGEGCFEEQTYREIEVNNESQDSDVVVVADTLDSQNDVSGGNRNS